MKPQIIAQGAEAIIVLGHESDKEKLSDLCIKRLEKALEIYSKKEVSIIFSGGHSLKSKLEGPSEAALMNKYALQKGVNPKNIILEENSRDTQGNAYFTKQIIKKKGWKRILVITSDFHILKTKFLFDFIYGPKFKISYIGVKTNLTEGKIKKIKEKEKKSQEIIAKIYKEENIKPEEEEKIGKILKTFYAKFN